MSTEGPHSSHQHDVDVTTKCFPNLSDATLTPRPRRRYTKVFELRKPSWRPSRDIFFTVRKLVHGMDVVSSSRRCSVDVAWIVYRVQRRRKQFESGHGERGARAYKGVWGWSPQQGPGAEPLVRVSGGRSPPEAERFLRIIRRKDRQYLPLYPSFESAEIYPKHCLESKYVYGTQKIHTQCVRERDRLNCRSRSASDVQNHTVRSHYLAIIRE